MEDQLIGPASRCVKALIREDDVGKDVSFPAPAHLAGTIRWGACLSVTAVPAPRTDLCDFPQADHGTSLADEHVQTEGKICRALVA